MRLLRDCMRFKHVIPQNHIHHRWFTLCRYKRNRSRFVLYKIVWITSIYIIYLTLELNNIL